MHMISAITSPSAQTWPAMASNSKGNHQRKAGPALRLLTNYRSQQPTTLYRNREGRKPPLLFAPCLSRPARRADITQDCDFVLISSNDPRFALGAISCSPLELAESRPISRMRQSSSLTSYLSSHRLSHVRKSHTNPPLPPSIRTSTITIHMQAHIHDMPTSIADGKGPPFREQPSTSHARLSVARPSYARQTTCS